MLPASELTETLEIEMLHDEHSEGEGEGEEGAHGAPSRRRGRPIPTHLNMAEVDEWSA